MFVKPKVSLWAVRGVCRFLSGLKRTNADERWGNSFCWFYGHKGNAKSQDSVRLPCLHSQTWQMQMPHSSCITVTHFLERNILIWLTQESPWGKKYPILSLFPQVGHNSELKLRISWLPQIMRKLTITLHCFRGRKSLLLMSWTDQEGLGWNIRSLCFWKRRSCSALYLGLDVRRASGLIIKITSVSRFSLIRFQLVQNSSFWV